MRHIINVGKGFGKKSFEKALEMSHIGDLILLEPGTYDYPAGFSINNLEIKGVGNNPNDVILNTAFFLSDNSKLHLSNLTVNAPSSKNALNAKSNSSFSLDKVILKGEQSGEYPAIWIENASLTVRSSEIYYYENNGAVFITKGGRAIIESSIVESLYISESQVILMRSQICTGIYAENQSSIESRDLVDFLGKNLAANSLTILSGSTASFATFSGSENNLDAKIEESLLTITNAKLLEGNLFNIYYENQSTIDVSGERVFKINIDEQKKQDWFEMNSTLLNNEELVNDEKINTMENEDDSTLSNNEFISTNIDELNCQSAIEELNNLYGLEIVKKQILDFISTVKFNKIRKSNGLKATSINLHSCFLGNPGTGKTTVARILGRVLSEEGVIQTDNFIEVTRKDLVGQHYGETSKMTQHVLESALGGVLFIDEAYTLYQENTNEWGQEAVDTILKFMEDHRDDLMIIFAGYTDRMQTFLNMNPGLVSRVPNSFNFEDYSPEEIAKIGYNNLLQEQYLVNERRYKDIVINMYSHSIDNSNARWIRNFNQNLIMIMARRVIEENISDSQTITDKDLDKLVGGNKDEKEKKTQELLKKLDSLTGLENVKEYIHRLVKQVSVDKELAKNNPYADKPTYHMVFEGNQGTGKTTVANILASLFYNLDILPQSNVKVVDRSDLVGAYIGHTEKNTKQVIMEAMGGVLFIDEAYQLTPGYSNDFGKQAIETLITALENYRDKFITIFAGYTKEMEQFLDTNPGLRSRIPITIVFPDYSSQEIAEIVNNHISKNWNIDKKKLFKVVETIYSKIPNNEKANARWARNFSDKLIQKHKVWLAENKVTGPEMKNIDSKLLDQIFFIYDTFSN